MLSPLFSNSAAHVGKEKNCQKGMFFYIVHTRSKTDRFSFILIIRTVFRWKNIQEERS